MHLTTTLHNPQSAPALYFF
jgi:hypothetical protein